jgi:16S rRNA (guanine966-N2)-methyltransferase
MRIIAGKYRSRLLKSLKGDALRPTSDRLRETLFDILGADVAGSRFLDVFAGTGAVGIEALSRGAAEAIFIEKHAPASKLIRANLESLGITQGATILTSDALTAMQKLAARHASAAPVAQALLPVPSHQRPSVFAETEVRPEATQARVPVLRERPMLVNFVFVDPPYANHEDYTRTLAFLGSDAAAFLAADALVIFEHHHKFALPENAGRLTRTRILKQGDAALSFYRGNAGAERERV